MLLYDGKYTYEYILHEHLYAVVGTRKKCSCYDNLVEISKLSSAGMNVIAKPTTNIVILPIVLGGT